MWAAAETGPWLLLFLRRVTSFIWRDLHHMKANFCSLDLDGRDHRRLFVMVVSSSLNDCTRRYNPPHSPGKQSLSGNRRDLSSKTEQRVKVFPRCSWQGRSYPLNETLYVGSKMLKCLETLKCQSQNTDGTFFFDGTKQGERCSVHRPTECTQRSHQLQAIQC